MIIIGFNDNKNLGRNPLLHKGSKGTGKSSMYTMNYESKHGEKQLY